MQLTSGQLYLWITTVGKYLEIDCTCIQNFPQNSLLLLNRYLLKSDVAVKFSDDLEILNREDVNYSYRINSPCATCTLNNNSSSITFTLPAQNNIPRAASVQYISHADIFRGNIFRRLIPDSIRRSSIVRYTFAYFELRKYRAPRQLKRRAGEARAGKAKIGGVI